MLDDLNNMKKLADVKVNQIIIDNSTDRLIFTVRYIVIAEDDSEMYSTSCTHDMTSVDGIGGYTIAQMNAWAKARAVEDAKKKWGK